MKKFLTATTCLVFLGLIALGTAPAQQMRTGDRGLDALLVKINEQATADPDAFIRLLSQKNNFPETEILRVKEFFGLGFGDTYMAATLSRISGQPIEVVAETYERNQGRGWGVTAMKMGIKPGSPAFRELKANARNSVRHMKTMAKSKKKQQEKDRKKARERGR